MKTVIGSTLLLLLSCSTTSPSSASPIPDQQQDTETPTIKTRHLLRGGDHQQQDEQQERHRLLPPVSSDDVPSPDGPSPYCHFAGYSKSEYDGTNTPYYRLYSTTFKKNVRGSDSATVNLSTNTGEWEEWVFESTNGHYRIRNLYHGYYLKAQPGGDYGEVSVACADDLSGLSWDVEVNESNGKIKLRSVKWGTYLRPMNDNSINQTNNGNNYWINWRRTDLGEL